MEKRKMNVVQDYEKLSEELKEQVKLVYPEGFSDYLVEFQNSKGEWVSALRFETDEKVYLLRMSEKLAMSIMDDDDDYDEDYNLTSDAKESLQSKHGDVDYLSDNDQYDEDENEAEDEVEDEEDE